MTAPGSPRRVLMTTDTVGGVWQYALELSRGLGDCGVSVVLATMGPPPDAEQRAAVAEIENVTLCQSEFRLEWMQNPWADVEQAGEWLLGLEWEFAPDIVHLNGYAHGALPWAAPKLVVGHSCVCSWWEAVHGSEAPREWQRYRAMVADGIHHADAVVAPSRAMLDALQRHYGRGRPTRAEGSRRGATHSRSGTQRSGSWSVIPNGRDPARFGPAAEKEPFVLSVGRLWDEAKNAATLAAIAPELRWPVCVAGDTVPPDGAPRVLPNVDALGRCATHELADLYARAAIYALPARYEPFGLSVLEAALSGCALVLGDIASLRETWDGAALFVPPEDHRALREALAELIDDATLRQWLAARARLRAVDYTTDRMVDGYLRIYRRLARSATRRAPAAQPDVRAAATSTRAATLPA